MSRPMWKWYLSHIRTTKAQASMLIRATRLRGNVRQKTTCLVLLSRCICTFEGSQTAQRRPHMAEWLRPLIFSALNRSSSHRCGFEPSSGHMWDKPCSACGWSSCFSRGSPVFAPPTQNEWNNPDGPLNPNKKSTMLRSLFSWDGSKWWLFVVYRQISTWLANGTSSSFCFSYMTGPRYQKICLCHMRTAKT